jgi:orotidine-5'-phosphate decarboxylase
MTTQQLIRKFAKKSFLCIGLDVDLTRFHSICGFRRSIFEFNKAIIDATHDLCVSYKPKLLKHGLKVGNP